MPYEAEVREVETDVLILGGGMSGCGAAVEASYWAKPLGLKVTLVDKAAIDRSGAVAMGLSAINTYLGMSGRASYGQWKPEDFVKYVRTDLMGIIREDLVYDIARHVDSTVHLFEKWGLPIWKDKDGKYVREGPWQVMINGESYKVIVAEAAKSALGMDNIYERVMITHLLTDDNDPNRVCGAVGFSVREDVFYVFKAKAVIAAMGGAVHVFRPRSTGEGLGRAWYPPWNAGSTYALMAQVGAELTCMDVRFVPARYKDGYGPVGAWFLLFRSKATNAYGEEYMVTRKAEVEKFQPYGSMQPMPTCLRNHAMLLDMREGKGPIYMRTPEAIKALAEEIPDEKARKKKFKELESEAWEDFLDMTISQALLWAAMNIDPAQEPSEIMPAEPYFIGSHAGASGAWVCGPSDAMPDEYKDAFPAHYNRMTTVMGLFTCGDGAGASGHKFSSGSFTEGRIAAKAAVRFVRDNKDYTPSVSEDRINQLKEIVYRPLNLFEQYKNATTRPEVNPNYIRPKMFMFRLQKMMCEYCGGAFTYYSTSEKMLTHLLKLLQFLKEDSEKLAAEDLHELMRCWENIHRMWVAEAHARTILARKETRYPGYVYRADYPDLDDENWRKFVNVRYNPQTNEWEIIERPYIQLVPE